MADIVLAEVSGQGWLVRGEQYIDDLLGNTLSPHVSIEVVTCESKLAVDALWAAEGGDDPASMWLIHPAILNRSKGMAAPMTIHFAPWSAALDPDALRTLQLAATIAEQTGGDIALVRTIPPEPLAMAVQMADLRSALIEAELAKIPVPQARIRRDTITDGEPDRIQLVIRQA